MIFQVRSLVFFGGSWVWAHNLNDAPVLCLVEQQVMGLSSVFRTNWSWWLLWRCRSSRLMSLITVNYLPLLSAAAHTKHFLNLQINPPWKSFTFLVQDTENTKCDIMGCRLSGGQNGGPKDVCRLLSSVIRNRQRRFEGSPFNQFVLQSAKTLRPAHCTKHAEVERQQKYFCWLLKNCSKTF